MHALIISPQPFFSARGTPFSVYYRTLIMSELGVTADLLTYGQGEDVDIPGVRIIRLPALRWLGKIRTGPSMLKAFLDLLIMFWAFALLVKNRYDFVHAHEEAVFFSRYFKKLFKYKLVYDMHSSLPQQLRNFDFTRSEMIHRIFQSQEEGAIKASDAIITICDDLSDFVVTIEDDRGKLFQIENSIFDPVKLRNPAQSTAGSTAEVPALPEDKRLVVYAGTLENYQGIEILIEAFGVVAKDHRDAFLVIVGGTEQQVDKYQTMAGDEGIADRCLLTGQLPQQQANEIVSRADVVLSPRSEGTNTPLKIYQQLASGTPLVATNIYSHTQVLDETVAFLVEPEPGSMAAGISRVLANPEAAREIATNAQALYARKYSRDEYVAKMKSLLDLIR